MEPKASKESIVAHGTSIKGTVSSECPVTVSGVLDGELSAPTLVVTETGSVSGKIKVEDIKSAGELSGEIDAGSLLLSGRVRDNTSIRAKTLEVKLSSSDDGKLQVVFGTAVLEVGPDPATRKPAKPADIPV